MRPGKRLGWSIRICTSESSLSSAESFTSPLDLPLWGAFATSATFPRQQILSGPAGDSERAENLQKLEYLWRWRLIRWGWLTFLQCLLIEKKTFLVVDMFWQRAILFAALSAVLFFVKDLRWMIPGRSRQIAWTHLINFYGVIVVTSEFLLQKEVNKNTWQIARSGLKM